MVINHSSLEYSKLWLLAKKYIKCSLILIFFRFGNAFQPRGPQSLSNLHVILMQATVTLPPLFHWVMFVTVHSIYSPKSDLLFIELHHERLWTQIYWEHQSVYWKGVNDPLNESGTPQLPHETPSQKKCHISTLPYFVVCGPHHSSCN